MAPGPSQTLAFVDKDFLEQCHTPPGMYCLGLLLYYWGTPESLQRRPHGLQTPNMDSAALPEGVSASAAGRNGRRLPQGVAVALC